MAWLRHTPAFLSNWWMEACPYDPVRDRPALELYCRYNQSPAGIRLTHQRLVCVFRRDRVNYYPADGGQAART